MTVMMYVVATMMGLHMDIAAMLGGMPVEAGPPSC
jgi:hypothetical protein